jgi:hypothetical protein
MSRSPPENSTPTWVKDGNNVGRTQPNMVNDGGQVNHFCIGDPEPKMYFILQLVGEIPSALFFIAEFQYSYVFHFEVGESASWQDCPTK